MQPNQQNKDISKGSAFFNRHEQGSTWENVITTSEVAWMSCLQTYFRELQRINVGGFQYHDLHNKQT